MRQVKRVPVVFAAFKQNATAYAKFLGLETTSEEFRKARDLFITNYEQLFAKAMQNPDIRFGQLLFNEGIVPDGQHYFIEEDEWLVKNGFVKGENVYSWGTFGLDREKQFAEWNAAKPVWNAPLSKYEETIYAGLKNYEIYSRRYQNWIRLMPQQTFVYLKDLDTDHIKNIIANVPNVRKDYLAVFGKLLEERGELEPSVEIVDFEVICDDDKNSPN